MSLTFEHLVFFAEKAGRWPRRLACSSLPIHDCIENTRNVHCRSCQINQFRISCARFPVRDLGRGPWRWILD